ncbi:hypothetical protein U1Q18_038441 [Sarracenia purpurea var. burkii]
MVALKKAYADIILNTAKEAAARVMESERKALRFQQDTRATKDEALRMLLRLKKMLDSKTTEAEIESLGQQKNIEELSAQLDEAEERILELRAELKKARDELDKLKNNHGRSLNGLNESEKHDGPCDKGTQYELMNSNPIISYHTDSGPHVITSEPKNTTLSLGNIDCNYRIKSKSDPIDVSDVIREKFLSMNPANQSESLKPDLEKSCDRNGCTQRVRAFERDLLDGHMPSYGNVDDQHVHITSESITKVDEKHMEICTVPPSKTEDIDIMKNPTRVEDRAWIKSCTSKDQPLNVHKTRQRTKNRYGRAKATSCRYVPNLAKPHQACASPLGEAENKNSRENFSGLEGKVQQPKDQASCVVRRDCRKRRVKSWDAIAASCRCLPGQLTKPCSVLSCCKNYLVNCNLESGIKIGTDADPISGSTDLNLQNKEVGSSGFTGNAENKDTEFVDEAALVQRCGDATENHRVLSCKSNHIDNKSLTDSYSKDEKIYEATRETTREVGHNRLVKYTFSRKRKKESLSGHDENTALGKNSAKKRVKEKQNGTPVPQKSSLTNESSRDSRRTMQVARQVGDSHFSRHFLNYV